MKATLIEKKTGDVTRFQVGKDDVWWKIIFRNREPVLKNSKFTYYELDGDFLNMKGGLMMNVARALDD